VVLRGDVLLKKLGPGSAGFDEDPVTRTIAIVVVAPVLAAHAAQLELALGSLGIGAFRAVFQAPLVPMLDLGLRFVGSSLASSKFLHPFAGDLLAVLVEVLPLGSVGILSLAHLFGNLLAMGFG